jgi:hypothetical protein
VAATLIVKAGTALTVHSKIGSAGGQHCEEGESAAEGAAAYDLIFRDVCTAEKGEVATCRV